MSNLCTSFHHSLSNLVKALATTSATTERGSNSIMEEVAVSVGGGNGVPLFLLGKNTTQAVPPYAMPDGSLQGRKTTGIIPSSISEMYEASPYTSEAASIRRLSTSQVTAPPPLASAKEPHSKDDKKEEDAKMTSV